MFFRLLIAGLLAAGLGLAQRSSSRNTTPDQDAANAAMQMRQMQTRFDRLAASF